MDVKLSPSEMEILNFLDSNDAKFAFWDNTVQYITAKTNQSFSKTSDILKKLIKLEFATEEIRDEKKYYEITSEGVSYLELTKKTNKDKIIWNIIVPVVVSTITAAITTLITISIQN